MNTVSNRNAFLGEFIGTFMLVFFGCSTVAVTVLFGTLVGQFQIAVCWGITITLSIYMTRHICNAHFNPAVTIAMAASGRLRVKEVPVYLPDPSRQILPGEECLVVFADACIDGWMATGAPAVPAVPRAHALSDAFAFVGFWSKPRAALD